MSDEYYWYEAVVIIATSIVSPSMMTMLNNLSGFLPVCELFSIMKSYITAAKVIDLRLSSKSEPDEAGWSRFVTGQAIENG